MIGRLKCSWCLNRIHANTNDDTWKCKAFPEGIPEDKLMYITRDPCIDCNGGFGFEPDENDNTYN